MSPSDEELWPPPLSPLPSPSLSPPRVFPMSSPSQLATPTTPQLCPDSPASLCLTLHTPDTPVGTSVSSPVSPVVRFTFTVKLDSQLLKRRWAGSRDRDVTPTPSGHQDGSGGDGVIPDVVQVCSGGHDRTPVPAVEGRGARCQTTAMRLSAGAAAVLAVDGRLEVQQQTPSSQVTHSRHCTPDSQQQQQQPSSIFTSCQFERPADVTTSQCTCTCNCRTVGNTGADRSNGRSTGPGRQCQYQ